MSWQTSYTETGLRLGAGPPVRPGSTLGVVSVLLSRSLSVPGRHLKKGGRLPSPLLLAPTQGWPPRDGLVSATQLPTPGWPLEWRRETPPRQFFFSFFGRGGGEAGGSGGGGARSGEISLGRDTWAGDRVEGEGLGVGVFSGVEVLGPGFWVEWRM